MKTTNMDSQSSENWHLSSPVNKVMTSFLRKVRLFNEKKPAGNKRGFSCSISCVPTTGHSEITSLPAAIRRMIWVGQIIWNHTQLWTWSPMSPVRVEKQQQDDCQNADLVTIWECGLGYQTPPLTADFARVRIASWSSWICSPIVYPLLQLWSALSVGRKHHLQDMHTGLKYV